MYEKNKTESRPRYFIHRRFNTPPPWGGSLYRSPVIPRCLRRGRLLALFVIYLIVLFKITIFRDSSSGAQSVNLIPFTTIAEYLKTIVRGNRIIGISNILGNFILFLPLGYMAASLFPKMRKQTRILTLAIVFSLAIEVFQYIFACGSADLDDVILNALGGVAGYWVYILTSRLFKPKKYAIFMSASMIAVTCIGFFAFSHYRFLVDRSAPGNLPGRAERLVDDFTGPFAIDEEPKARLSTGAIVGTNFNADSTAGAQNNADEAAWNFIFVNKWNAIPDDYEVELTESANGQWVDKRISPSLQEMFDAARDDDVYPVVVSGYRTAEEQQSLLDEKIAAYKAEGYSAEEAITKAEAWVAVPGTSEHQLGIAVDLGADGIHSTGEEVYEWMGQNSYKFGFIRRYPPDKTEITGVINEPWHYRYVGVEAATEMYHRGICLEEYLGKINDPAVETPQRSRGITGDAIQGTAPRDGELDRNRSVNERGS